MKLFRICKSKFARDLSGEGAKNYGGRWNSKGVPMLYTSTSISLAILETLVHVPRHLLPKELFLITIEIPDSASCLKVDLEDLSPNWRNYPAPRFTEHFGSERVKSKESLCLFVPSVLVPMEENVLINVLHSEFSGIEVVDMKELKLDERLFAKQ